MLLKKKKKLQNNSTSVKKEFTKWYPQIFSRHHSHAVLRRALPLLPYRVTIRLGSTTESIAKVQINSIQGVRNSSNKLLMKQAFDRAGVKTAPWCKAAEFKSQFEFPIVVKNHYGSRGTGNYKINTQKEWENWKKGRDLNSYLVEAYRGYLNEFRLHVTEEGCFYACRKALKKDTPKEDRWRHHDDNCIWLVESNKDFQKPSNWKQIEKECVAALKQVGLDVASFDVKVQGKEKTNPDFILIECNSASSFGKITEEKYKEILPKLIQRKYEERN